MKRRTDIKPVAAFMTLGCKANRYDASAIMGMIDTERWEIVDAGSGGRIVADVYVINTCAVTGTSAFQSRQMVRRVRRWNPEAKVIATGCLAGLEAEALKKAGADLVAGLDERGRIVEALGGEASPVAPVFHHPAGGRQTRGRAVIKVQDGCDSACAYCIVRIARGRSRSLPQEAVISQLGELAQKGFHEAVLTGVHLGLYGRDTGGSLASLLRAIADEPGMPERIRLSSIEPMELTDELIEIVAHSGVFAPHLHVPLQSGDASVLEMMRRPYRPEEIEEKLNLARSLMPHAGIGLDLIAGFPCESERMHANTARLIERLPASYLHVFPFSKRPGTPAADMPGQTPAGVIKERAKELREIGAKKKKEFMDSQVGRTLEVVAETEKAGRISGISGNYCRVSFAGRDITPGSIVRVRITAARADGLDGEYKQE